MAEKHSGFDSEGIINMQTNAFKVDTVQESTSGAGVTLEKVLHIKGTSSNNVPLLVTNEGAGAYIRPTTYRDSASAGGVSVRHARGTLASPTVITLSDDLGYLFFDGYDGSAFLHAASIAATNEVSVGSNDMAGRLTFATTPSGAADSLTRVVISSEGKVGIGNGTALTALLDVQSNIIRLRTAKTPSSAADTGNAGDICWDANYIYVCVATDTWKRTAITTW